MAQSTPSKGGKGRDKQNSCHRTDQKRQGQNQNQNQGQRRQGQWARNDRDRKQREEILSHTKSIMSASCKYRKLKSQHENWGTCLKEAFIHHRAAVIVGPTGSGKSTRVPLALTRLFPGSSVLVVEPRRLPCLHISSYVANVNNLEIGRDIGVVIGQHVRYSQSCLVTYATSRAALNRLLAGGSSFPFNIIVIDEVHERERNTELFISVLHEIMLQRPDLRVVIMSATIQTKLFSNFFAYTDQSRAEVNTKNVFSAPIIKFGEDTGLYPVASVNIGDRVPAIVSKAKEIGGASAAVTWHDVIQIRVNDLCSAMGRELIPLLTSLIPGSTLTYNGAVNSLYQEAMTALTLASPEREGFAPDMDETKREKAASHWVDEKLHRGSILVFIPDLTTIKTIKGRMETHTFKMSEHDFNSPDIARLLATYAEAHPDSPQPTSDAVPLAAFFKSFILHSSVSREGANEVINEQIEGARKVILSTNISETSLTFPDVTIVIDFGLSRTTEEKTTHSLVNVLNSQQSAAQRKGRIGRVQGGIYLNLRPSLLDSVALTTFLPQSEQLRQYQDIRADYLLLLSADFDVAAAFRNGLSMVPRADISFVYRNVVSSGLVSARPYTVNGDRLESELKAPAHTAMGRLVNSLPLSPENSITAVFLALMGLPYLGACVAVAMKKDIFTMEAGEQRQKMTRGLMSFWPPLCQSPNADELLRVNTEDAVLDLLEKSAVTTKCKQLATVLTAASCRALRPEIPYGSDFALYSDDLLQLLGISISWFREYEAQVISVVMALSRSGFCEPPMPAEMHAINGFNCDIVSTQTQPVLTRVFGEIRNFIDSATGCDTMRLWEEMRVDTEPRRRLYARGLMAVGVDCLSCAVASAMGQGEEWNGVLYSETGDVLLPAVSLDIKESTSRAEVERLQLHRRILEHFDAVPAENSNCGPLSSTLLPVQWSPQNSLVSVASSMHFMTVLPPDFTVCPLNPSVQETLFAPGLTPPSSFAPPVPDSSGFDHYTCTDMSGSVFICSSGGSLSLLQPGAGIADPEAPALLLEASDHQRAAAYEPVDESHSPLLLYRSNPGALSLAMCYQTIFDMFSTRCILPHKAAANSERLSINWGSVVALGIPREHKGLNGPVCYSQVSAAPLTLASLMLTSQRPLITPATDEFSVFFMGGKIG